MLDLSMGLSQLRLAPIGIAIVLDSSYIGSGDVVSSLLLIRVLIHLEQRLGHTVSC